MGPSYKLPTPVGDITTNLNFYHNSGYYAAPDNRLRQQAYNLINVDVLFVPKAYPHISLDLYGKNLTNAVYASELQETQFGDFRLAAPGQTYGFTVGLHY